MNRTRRAPARPEPRLRPSQRPPSARRSSRGARREGGLTRLLRRLLGIRRVVTVDGVRYREAKPVPIEKAIGSRRHAGKSFEVTFPSGRAMTITATRRRRYADLMDIPELRAARLAEPLVRPGSRVLILGGGTGGLAALVSGWVGPHGGVVSVEHDGESVRFARRRYPLEGVSVERGGAETLSGELDESFDTVVVSAAWLARAKPRDRTLLEAWRVTRLGGRLIAIGDHEAKTAGEYLGFDAGPARFSRRAAEDGGPELLVIEKPDPSREMPDPSRGVGD